MLLSTLATLGSLGTTIYTQAKARRENEKRVNEENATNIENERILNTRINSDFARGSEFQGYWNAKQQADDKRIARERGINSVVGGNENAIEAQREASATSEAQMGSRLAVQGDAVKRSAENALIRENNRHSKTMQGIYKERADQITQAGAQFANTMSAVAKADANTIGDDLNTFGVQLDTDKWEKVPSGDGLSFHWVRKRAGEA